MKKIKLIALSIAFASTGFTVDAQDEKQHTITAVDPKVKEEMEKAEKAWAEYMTPGSIHEMLAKSDGDWQAEITSWMDPGVPPTVNIAHCTNKMILGGRYQQSIHRGEFNGMPFEGISTVAYDNALKMYISTWIDNMGTGIMVLKGTYDEEKRILTSTGKMVDPVSGKEVDIRETMTFVDENSHVMEMFQMKNGKEHKIMQIKFMR